LQLEICLTLTPTPARIAAQKDEDLKRLGPFSKQDVQAQGSGKLASGAVV
jgi:hypothetical protein